MSAAPKRLRFRQPDPEPTVKPREWREFIPEPREPHVFVQRREKRRQASATVIADTSPSHTPTPTQAQATDIAQLLRPKSCCTEWAKQLKLIRRARKQRENDKRNKRQDRQRAKVDQPDRRLPHGSRYETDFDWDTQMWTGTLKTSVAGKLATFLATDAALMRLIPKLARMYQEAKVAHSSSEITPDNSKSAIVER